MSSLLVDFVSEKELYLAYMPFLKNGGIFIRTSETFEMGAEIVLDITLPDSLESSEVKGVVCWQTPAGSQSGSPAGVGVSFEEDPDNIRHQIEKVIGRMLNSSEPTHTM